MLTFILQKRFYWAPEHDPQIRKNFNEKGISRLKDTVGELRKKNKQPLLLSNSTWKSLQEYWASEKFKKMSAQVKKNRNRHQDGLGPSLHTCGSIPFSEQKRRLVIFASCTFYMFCNVGRTLIYFKVLTYCIGLKTSEGADYNRTI